MSTKARVTTTTKSASSRSEAAKKAAATRAANKAAATKAANATKETTTATSAVPMLHAFVPEAKTPYAGKVQSDRLVFRSFTVAGFIVTGFATISDSGLASIANKGNLTLLKLIIGTSASGYWRRKGWLDDKGLTDSGKTEISQSFVRDNGFYARVPTVRALVALMRSGGKGNVPGKAGDIAMQFNARVGAKA